MGLEIILLPSLAQCNLPQSALTLSAQPTSHLHAKYTSSLPEDFISFGQRPHFPRRVLDLTLISRQFLELRTLCCLNLDLALLYPQNSHWEVTSFFYLSLYSHILLYTTEKKQLALSIFCLTFTEPYSLVHKPIFNLYSLPYYLWLCKNYPKIRILR